MTDTQEPQEGWEETPEKPDEETIAAEQQLLDAWRCNDWSRLLEMVHAKIAEGLNDE